MCQIPHISHILCRKYEAIKMAEIMVTRVFGEQDLEELLYEVAVKQIDNEVNGDA